MTADTHISMGICYHVMEMNVKDFEVMQPKSQYLQLPDDFRNCRDTFRNRDAPQRSGPQFTVSVNPRRQYTHGADSILGIPFHKKKNHRTDMLRSVR